MSRLKSVNNRFLAPPEGLVRLLHRSGKQVDQAVRIRHDTALLHVRHQDGTVGLASMRRPHNTPRGFVLVFERSGHHTLL